MCTIKEMWIARTHYDGDDWRCDGVYVGFTRADVEAQIVEVFNEDVRNANKDAEELGTGEGPWPEYTSLNDAINQNDGELFYEVWCNDRDVEVPADAIA